MIKANGAEQYQGIQVRMPPGIRGGFMVGILSDNIQYAMINIQFSNGRRGCIWLLLLRP
jgi:hypothetical protein